MQSGGIDDAGKTKCWVAMPEHVHWLMTPTGSLEMWRCVQKVEAKATLALRDSSLWAGPVWQRGFHDRAGREEEDLRAMARYVIANPVRAGLVRSVRDWLGFFVGAGSGRDR